MEFILKILYWLSSQKNRRKLDLMFLGHRILTQKNSYLLKVKYADSLLLKHAGKNFDRAVPWMCFPLIEFLNDRLNPNHTIFEYGSGNSTLFFADRVKSIVSIEHNKDWFDRISNQVKNNDRATVVFQQLTNVYPRAIEIYGANNKFDLVIVDGRNRVDCIKNAVHYLTTHGIILLDDSERDRYKEAFVLLASKGFSHITFKGMKPGIIRQNEGTIFYRKGSNCFEI